MQSLAEFRRNDWVIGNVQYFVHLLNDLSGSVRIINAKIEAYSAQGDKCFVVTNTTDGFIKDAGHDSRKFRYFKHPNMAMWVFNLARWHVMTFAYLLRTVGRGDTVHCSTLLTAPHLLAARIKGARAVIHIMETELKPAVHRAILLWFVRTFAQHIVYLSAYVEQRLGDAVGHRAARTITYPCVDASIVNAAGDGVRGDPDPARFTVGMVCSHIWHKGYAEFVALAAMVPHCRFLLVVNGNEERFRSEFADRGFPANLELRFNVRAVADAFGQMDLLLSLTKREGWVETFGLTLAEAMIFGVPVIAPDIGAPKEFVVDGENGFLVDERDLPRIAALIDALVRDPALWRTLSRGARATALGFAPERFAATIARERAFLSGGRA